MNPCILVGQLGLKQWDHCLWYCASYCTFLQTVQRASPVLKEPGQLWNIQQNSHNSLPLNPQPRRFKEVSSCHSSCNLHVTGVECNFCGTFALDVTYPYEALTAATCCKCMAHRKRRTRRPWRSAAAKLSLSLSGARKFYKSSGNIQT